MLRWIWIKLNARFRVTISFSHFWNSRQIPNIHNSLTSSFFLLCLVCFILRSLNANASDLFSFISSNSCLCSYKSFDTFPPLTIVCHVIDHFKSSDIQNTVLNNRVFILFTYLQELLNTGIFTIGYGITTLFQLINWASVNYYGRTSNIIAAVSLIVSHVFIFPSKLTIWNILFLIKCFSFYCCLFLGIRIVQYYCIHCLNILLVLGAQRWRYTVNEHYSNKDSIFLLINVHKLNQKPNIIWRFFFLYFFFSFYT